MWWVLNSSLSRGGTRLLQPPVNGSLLTTQRKLVLKPEYSFVIHPLIYLISQVQPEARAVFLFPSIFPRLTLALRAYGLVLAIFHTSLRKNCDVESEDIIVVRSVPDQHVNCGIIVISLWQHCIQRNCGNVLVCTHFLFRSVGDIFLYPLHLNLFVRSVPLHRVALVLVISIAAFCLIFKGLYQFSYHNKRKNVGFKRSEHISERKNNRRRLNKKF